MGIFDLFQFSKFERELINYYYAYFAATGNSSFEAKKKARQMIQQAKEYSRKEGTFLFPQNLGDIILGSADTDDPAIKKVAEIVRQNLPSKRKEGVRDEDVRWWWNLNDIERHAIVLMDDISKFAMYSSVVDHSTASTREDAADKATAEVRKMFPMYGNPDDTTHTTGEDRPLPFELKDRINIYFNKRMDTDPGEFKREMKITSSYNALIRIEIRDGRV